MAEAVAGNTDDPKPWNLLRGASLFWQGVLLNDRDTPGAVPILKASVEALRPAVEADPQNVEARFRLAEALRWVGLAETSSEETAAVEREAIGEYQKIWKDRATLDIRSRRGCRRRLRLRARQSRANDARNEPRQSQRREDRGGARRLGARDSGARGGEG